MNNQSAAPNPVRFQTREAVTKWLQENQLFGFPHETRPNEWIAVQLDGDKLIALISSEEGIWLSEW